MAHYALFVANARYHSEGLPPLHGPESDVDKLCGLFRNTLGYDAAQVLKGASADEVSVSFNRLGSRAKPGDTVLFYFSGHGVESLDGKEQYMLFEYADLSELSRGINTPTGCLAVSKLLNNSDHWTGVQRVFVFDACRVLVAARGSSGCMVDSLRFGREEVLDALARGPVYSRNTKQNTSAFATSTAAPPVLIKACLSSQEALELPGRKRGVFSLAFGQVLSEAARRGQTLSTGPALLGQIQQEMAPLLRQLPGSPRQTPWISAGAPSVLLFSLPHPAPARANWPRKYRAVGAAVVVVLVGASGAVWKLSQSSQREATPTAQMAPPISETARNHTDADSSTLQLLPPVHMEKKAIEEYPRSTTTSEKPARRVEETLIESSVRTDPNAAVGEAASRVRPDPAANAGQITVGSTVDSHQKVPPAGVAEALRAEKPPLTTKTDSVDSRALDNFLFKGASK